MAIKLVNLGPSGTTQLVAAESGKIIRLLRILLAPGSEITIKSGSTSILPAFKCSTNGNSDKEFPQGNVQTDAGEALNAVSAALVSTMCWLEYDIVE